MGASLEGEEVKEEGRGSWRLGAVSGGEWWSLCHCRGEGDSGDQDMEQWVGLALDLERLTKGLVSLGCKDFIHSLQPLCAGILSHRGEN